MVSSANFSTLLDRLLSKSLMKMRNTILDLIIAITIFTIEMEIAVFSKPESESKS